METYNENWQYLLDIMEWQFVNAYFGRCHKSASAIFEASGNEWENDEHAMAWMRYDFIYCIWCVCFPVQCIDIVVRPLLLVVVVIIIIIIIHIIIVLVVPAEWVSCFDNTQFNLCPIDRTWTLNGISQAYTNDFVKFGWCNILIVVFNGQGNGDNTLAYE